MRRTAWNVYGLVLVLAVTVGVLRLPSSGAAGGDARRPGITFAPCFVHKLPTTPPCPVDVLYRGDLRIPSEKDAAGTWRIKRPVDRAALASAVTGALVAMENPPGESPATKKRRKELERFRPLLLDVEPWLDRSAQFGPGEITALNHWLVVTAEYITGREVGLVGDVDAEAETLYPMAYGPGSLGQDFLVDLDRAHGGRNICVFVCMVYGSGPERGKPLTPADFEKLAGLLANYAARCNGTFTVLVWSEAATEADQAAVGEWMVSLEARVEALVPVFAEAALDPEAS